MQSRENHIISCRKWYSKNPTYCNTYRKSKRADMTREELKKDKERVRIDSANAYARRAGYKDYQEYFDKCKSLKVYNRKIKEINLIIAKAHKKIERDNRKEKRKEERRIKIQTDDKLRLIENVRCRTRKILRIQSAKKTTRMAQLIGTSGNELYNYLFPEGKPGYKYHIDHIIPLSKFDLKIKEHQLIALHYFNLQILPYEENLKKHAALPDDWKQKIKDICKTRKISSKQIIEYIEKVA
jgi:hypothetical protein